MVVVDHKKETSLDELLVLVPALLERQHWVALAKVTNYFARQDQYDVIDNPEQFANEYRRQLTLDSPDPGWQQSSRRLRDYGMPELAMLSMPTLEGSTVCFHAKSRRLGVPYSAQVTIDDGEISASTYQPLPRTSFK